MTLGPIEELLGPDDRTDNPFHTLGRAPELVGYVANQDTYGFVGSSLDNLQPLPQPVLTRGQTGRFDSCGAWLNSTWRDGNIVRGWYHAETECNYPVMRKSVAYAESFDGGRTFSKPNYPNNQAITAPARYSDPVAGSEGDQHVIWVGDYYYMYFVAARDFQVRLARSRVSDGGRAGAWFKYYNGKFDQPGVGGESSPIAPDLLTRSWVSYNTALKLFIGFSYYDRGYGLAVSPDGVRWRRATDLVLPFGRQFGSPDLSAGRVADYVSLISTDGNSAEQGLDCYLYYMVVRSGEPINGHRYLVRQLLRLEPLYKAPDQRPSTDNPRRFSETGKTLGGRFRQYWEQHGGLVQQGYPISDEFEEVSDLNGQRYRVQYFERAVFEYHTQNQPPNDVLLSQLGSFRYRERYPAGADGQRVSSDNPRRFSETGKTLGGKFREYWERNGGLAQQGYPISDEFEEISPVDGKLYTVQYFERAAFEYHPENAGSQYEVLLSQLGRFRYREKYPTAP